MPLARRRFPRRSPKVVLEPTNRTVRTAVTEQELILLHRAAETQLISLTKWVRKVLVEQAHETLKQIPKPR